MHIKFGFVSLIALFLGIIACAGGASGGTSSGTSGSTSGGSASTSGVPYDLDKRPLPTAEDIDTLLPPTVGPFTRSEVDGQPTGGYEAYGTYTSPQGDAFLTVSIGASPTDAQGGVATAKGEVIGDSNDAVISLTTDPAYFFVSRSDAVFLAWSHGKYYFSLDPYNNQAVLDAFMAAYPY